MRVKAARFVKVRNAVTKLVQLADERDLDEPVRDYEDLDKEDQEFVHDLSKSLIELVDGLLDRGGKNKKVARDG